MLNLHLSNYRLESWRRVRVQDTRRMTDINPPVFICHSDIYNLKAAGQRSWRSLHAKNEFLLLSMTIYSSNLLCLSLVYALMSTCAAHTYTGWASMRMHFRLYVCMSQWESGFWSLDFLITAGLTIECYCSAIWYPHHFLLTERKHVRGGWSLKNERVRKQQR